jgi:uroporphyrinogen-III synthase
LLSQRGAFPLALPLIRIEPAGRAEQIEAALNDLSSYDWVVFTSANGVERFFDHLAGRPFSPNAAVVGPATGQALRARGITPAFMPSEHTGAALARGLLEHEDGAAVSGRILLPCAVDRSDDAARVLRTAGARVQELPIYRTVPEEPGRQDLAAIEGRIDAVLFFSGSAVRSLCALAGKTPKLAKALSKAVVGCIGPSTAESARKMGLRVDDIPEAHTSEALVDALEERFRYWKKGSANG